MKFKIILGYGILIVLLAVTIYLFRSGQVKRNTLLRNERKLVATWQLTEYCLEHKVSCSKMYQIVRKEFPNLSSIPGYRNLPIWGFFSLRFMKNTKIFVSKASNLAVLQNIVETMVLPSKK